MRIKKHNINKYHFLFLLISFLLASSCVDQYWPDLKGSDEQIVVIDGKITNEPGPYTVKLSYSSTLQNPQFNGIGDATVIIEDDEGNAETLTEVSFGVYQTAENGIQGTVGRSYKISVTVGQGKHLESDFQELLAPSSYESISAVEETRISQYNEEEYEEGYQFYVSPIINSNEQTFLYWEIIETYEYHSSYRIHRVYNGHKPGTEFGADENFRLPEADTLFRCWLTQPVSKKYVFNTAQLEESSGNKIPLHFIRYNSEEMKYKYSILVNQYNISEGAYTYMKNLADQQLNQGGLYTTQPYQLRGNIKNAEDENEIVLGYFLVGSREPNQSKRLTVETPQGKNIWEDLKCSGVEAPTGVFYDYEIRYYNKPDQLPLYLTWVGSGSMLLYRYPEYCVNCTLAGGTKEKPDYWDD